MSNVQYTLSLRDMFSGTLSQIEGRTDAFETKMGGLGSVIRGAFATAGLVAFGKSVLDVGMRIEDTQTGLTTMLRSQEKAAEVVKQVMDDAARTPFAFEGLMNTTRALISAGESAEQARENTLNLANALAAVGKGDEELQRMAINMQQIRNIGYAEREDLKQFASAGINVFKMLEAAGISSAKGTQVSADQISYAFKVAAQEGGMFFNGLGAMSQNTSVGMSNLGDMVDQLKIQMFNDLKPAITSVIQGLGQFIGHLKEGWAWLYQHREAVIVVGKAVAGLWIAFQSLRGLIAIGGIVQAFGLTLTASLGPIGLVVAALGGLVLAYDAVATAADRAKAAQQKEQAVVTQGLKEDLKTVSDIYKKQGLSEEAARKKAASERIASYNEDLDALRASLREKETLVQQAKWYNMPQDELDRRRADRDAIVQRMGEIEGYKKVTAGFMTEGLVNAPTAGLGGAANAGATTGKKVRGETRAVGNKAVTINVSIKDLIGTSNINVTNITEGAAKIKDIVTQALTGALNDFQITAQ